MIQSFQVIPAVNLVSNYPKELYISYKLIYQEIDGQKVPVTKSVVEPKIEGAIIVAKGAKNSIIKESIVQAIEAATGLATHKIQVFEMAN